MEVSASGEKCIYEKEKEEVLNEQTDYHGGDHRSRPHPHHERLPSPHLYAGKGKLAKSSADQVRMAVNIAKEMGLEPATPDEAREILGLKGIDKVGF